MGKWQPCAAWMVIDTVTLRCDSPYGAGHDGAHHDPDAQVRWKPDPEVEICDGEEANQ